MGDSLIQFLKRLKPEYKLAFLSALTIALFIHLYKFTNTLPNHDSLYNYYSDQNILGSGRWALSFACGFSSFYDLPWINGLFSCIGLAASNVVITALFELQNPIVIVLTGALLAASPSTTETFFFLFTADGYMLAMFLSALSVYLSQIQEHRIHRLILSCVCICVSCGIYQAYISFSLVLALFYYMVSLLENRYPKQDFYRWILSQLLIYSIALLSYWGIWQLCMKVQGVTANNYQGISEVGKVSLSLMAGGFPRSLRSVLLYFLQWDVLTHGFSIYSILNIIFLFILVLGLFLSFRNSGLYTRKWACLLFLLCLLLLVPFSTIWHFTSSSIGYRPMMLQCCTLYFLFCILLFERWSSSSLKSFVATFMLVVVANNALLANISYFQMNLCYERSYADGLEMTMRIHEIEAKQSFNQIAVIGNKLEAVQFQNIDFNTGKMRPSGQVHILNGGLETTLLFNAEHILPFLKYTFGIDYPSLSRSERLSLSKTEAVRAMPCWPDPGSLAVNDSVLILKISDTAEK